MRIREGNGWQPRRAPGHAHAGPRAFDRHVCGGAPTTTQSNPVASDPPPLGAGGSFKTRAPTPDYWFRSRVWEPDWLLSSPSPAIVLRMLVSAWMFFIR